MPAFTERFKRQPPSKTKRYLDRNTGEVISYRQAQKRAEAGGLTRNRHTPERKARARAGIARRASIRNSVLKRLGITSAEANRDPQVSNYIKFMTQQAKKGSSGFSRRNRISIEEFDEDFGQDFSDAIDDYNDYMASRGPVGGFISG
jgi:hypothetical protein